MGQLVIDYSTARYTSAQLHSAGVTGVLRYVGPPSWGKTIDDAEYDELVSGGIDVGLVFEIGADDVSGGPTAGQANVANLALPYLPKQFPADGVLFIADDTEHLTPSASVAYIGGAVSVRGAARSGAYAEGLVLGSLRSLGMVARYWRSASTSFPDSVPPCATYAHLLQGLSGPLPNTDIDQVMIEDWGQQPSPSPAPAPGGSSTVVPSVLMPSY